MPQARSAAQVVLDFCEAWDRRDLEGIMGLLSPAIVMQNVPRPAMKGHAEVLGFIRPFVEKTTAIEFRMSAIAADGETVFTERVDIMTFPKGVVEIPLMGIFVVRDGLIAEWRDYTDLGVAGAALSAVMPA